MGRVSCADKAQLHIQQGGDPWFLPVTAVDTLHRKDLRRELEAISGASNAAYLV